MKKVITLEIGNSSWWKNRKYRREAASEIRKLREKNSKVRLLKKYQLDSTNTIVYGDYVGYFTFMLILDILKAESVY